MKKQLLTIAFLFIAFATFSQAKKDSVKTMHQDLTESQVMQIVSALQIAKESDYIWDSPDIRTRQAKYFARFCDSLSAVYSNQIEKWNPPPPPKTDSIPSPKK